MSRLIEVLKEIDVVVDREVKRRADGWVAQWRQFSKLEERDAFLRHLWLEAKNGRLEDLERRAVIRAIELIEYSDEPPKSCGCGGGS